MSDIRETLRWHEAVHSAKVEKFGEQSFWDRLRLAKDLIREEVRELMDEVEALEEGREDDNKSVTKRAAKEAADILFVVIQLMHTLGVPFEEVYAEVLRSNWSKLTNEEAQFRDDGKLLKGPNYSPADIDRVFDVMERSVNS